MVTIATLTSQNSRPSSIISRTDDEVPFAKSWWFHSSPLPLDDPLAPFPKVALDEGIWKPFSSRDRMVLETKWNQFQDEMKRKEKYIPDNEEVVRELRMQTGERKDQYVSQGGADVIVGVERLYHVDLVAQRLEPIYWHPLSSSLDSSPVLRSTWFYADTRMPLEPSLSLSLEEGFVALRAWTSTYADELSSALALGLEAEAKLRWKVREDHKGREVFFINSMEAWIIPAAGVVQGLFGSKQVLKGIMDKGKGGTKVIRGYDNLMLDEEEEKESKPIYYTDLIFVIHGIGQKLSERVESFTFTHSVNRLRYHLNTERESEAVKRDLRSDYCPCILPINWRSRLSFDFDRPPDTSSRPTLSRKPSSASGILEDNVFTINDLQPNSIPIVRDLIKDVMLDIPCYLSSNKEKILEAAVSEANRVYKVFCRCNPYFQDKGRLHIIGHSLGSVIAMDVLSGQPTNISRSSDKVDKLHFEFDTTNLFCVGSPASLFLLLERTSLLPRAGRRKTKKAKNTEAEEFPGQFGCLSADNLYNIFDLTDPVALHMNPAVDSAYSRNNISAVQIPRVLSSSIGTLSQAVTVASSLLPSSPSSSKLKKSIIEMETHDFRSEARAERIFEMLNDNGGLDFVLTPLGGWVDNEYVSMLGAHQGYWDRKDFARMIVVETGREDEKPVSWLRAQKRVS